MIDSQRHLDILIEESRNNVRLIIEGISGLITKEFNLMHEELGRKYEPRFIAMETVLRKKSA